MLENKTKTAKIGVIAIVLLAAVLVFFFQTGNVEPIPVKGDQVTASQSASKNDGSAAETDGKGQRKIIWRTLFILPMTESAEHSLKDRHSRR